MEEELVDEFQSTVDWALREESLRLSRTECISSVYLIFYSILIVLICFLVLVYFNKGRKYEVEQKEEKTGQDSQLEEGEEQEQQKEQQKEQLKPLTALQMIQDENNIYDEEEYYEDNLKESNLTEVTLEA